LFWIFLALKSVQILSIKLECKFEPTNNFETGDVYTCSAENLEITEKNEKISSIDGKHGDGKSNADVECFEIRKQKVKFLPTGVKELFPRLKQIFVRKSQLEEIERKSFENMSTLEAVWVAFNNISSIHEDTFYDLTQLKILIIGENKLKTLAANLLTHQKKLENFNVQKNEIEKIPKGFFRNNLELMTIWITKNNLTDIDTADMFKMKKLDEVGLNGNKCINRDFMKIRTENLKEIKEKCSKGKASMIKKKYF
jgi:Leucine-rich repeat (LRR) protein